MRLEYVDAMNPTLYITEINNPDEAEHINELKQRSQHLSECRKLGVGEKLSSIFSNISEGTYTIVQTPKGESIKTAVCGAVLETVLTRPVCPSPRPSRLITPLITPSNHSLIVQHPRPGSTPKSSK